MSFPKTSVSSQLMPAEFDRLVKLLTVHYGYPLPYPLAGAYFEELFAASVGGKREPRKLLFDVIHGDIGWSLKTLVWSRLVSDATLEVVVQRCDILKNRELSLDSSEAVLGQNILEHFGRSCEASARMQAVKDPRAGFLIRNKKERDFVFFQQRFRLYDRREVEWRWANDDRKSLMGYADGSLVLRWYRSGTQLFGVYRIPRDPHSFAVDWRRAGLDETIQFFLNAGIARATKSS